MKANNTPQNSQMHLRINADLLTRAHQTARLTNQNLSDVVRTFLAAYVAPEPSNEAK